MSFDRLQEKIDRLHNPTVVGLDPALEHVPPEIMEKSISENGETLWAAALAVYEFNMGLIDALYDIVPAVKPQLAYYEALGPEGMIALKMTCEYARWRGMYIICDGKRNDIGPTAEAYSTAYLGKIKIGSSEFYPFDADAMTVNAYPGSDGIKPFIEKAVEYDKAVFAVVKTSNKSSGELQDLAIGTQEDGLTQEDGSPMLFPLYTAVGDLMEEISIDTAGVYGYTRVGAVVGATYPEELRFLRARLKNTFFLVPGYGTQGGAATDAARAFQKDGHGAIINSSRAVIAAWKKTGGDYAAAARGEALKMRDELRREIYI